MFDVTVEVDKDLRAMMAKTKTGLARVGKKVVTEAAGYTQREVRKFTPRNTGATQDSILYLVVEESMGDYLAWRATVFSELEKQQYVEVLEKGRTPGARMPPHAPIKMWVERNVTLKPGQTLDGVTFVIRRAIGERGFKNAPKGYRMFAKGFAKAKPFIKKIADRELAKAMRNL